MCTSSVNSKSQACATSSAVSCWPFITETQVRSQDTPCQIFVGRNSFATLFYPINHMLLLPTERSYCTFKKENAFGNHRASARKFIYVVFLSVTLIFYLLTCTDSSRTTTQTARKVKILIIVLRCIVVGLGVCLNKT